MADPRSEAPRDRYIDCASCHELNRPGTRACARCGERLESRPGEAVDPELRGFLDAQHEAQRDEDVEGHADNIAFSPVGFGLRQYARRRAAAREVPVVGPRVVADAAASPVVECSSCHERNRLGVVRCARCGDVLGD